MVPVGIDTTLFTQDGLRLPRGTQARLVTVSRLAERKGIRTLIEALARLPGCELLVAGGPDQAKAETDPVLRTLRDHARNHGVLTRVEFLGRVPHSEIPALLRSADVFVCAPYYEPFGTAALEAAACGIPVVATAVGGLCEHVIDGVTGRLVTPAPPIAGTESQTATALAAAVAELLTDPARRAWLGAEGARHAARYAWPRIADEIMNVYHKLLNPS